MEMIYIAIIAYAFFILIYSCDIKSIMRSIYYLGLAFALSMIEIEKNVIGICLYMGITLFVLVVSLRIKKSV